MTLYLIIFTADNKLEQIMQINNKKTVVNSSNKYSITVPIFINTSRFVDYNTDAERIP